MSSLTSRALLAPVMPKGASELRRDGIHRIHTHGSTETTIYLEDSKLIEVANILGLGEVGIGDDLIIGG